MPSSYKIFGRVGAYIGRIILFNTSIFALFIIFLQSIGLSWTANYQWPAKEATIDISGANGTIDGESFKTLAVTSMNNWLTYCSPSVDFTFYNADPPSDCSFNVRDSRNCTGWADLGSCSGTFTVGQTMMWLSGDNLIEADVAINSQCSAAGYWTSTRAIAVLSHEYGHAVGLGHSSDSSALMYPYLHDTIWYPRADDCAGFLQIYGSSSSLNFETNTDILTVPEGSTASFQVRLSAQPSSNVVVSVSRYSGDADISVVSGSSLTFTGSNWNIYQTVTLSAANDTDTVNGSAVIRVSAAGVSSKDVTANEVDNDSLNFVTDTDVLTVPEGDTAQFQVRLSAQPSSNLVATVSRFSGDANLSVISGLTLTFTTSNWNVYQTVTLSAAEDADTANGNAVIRVSAAGVVSKDVTANELDNDAISPAPSDFNRDGDPDILWRHRGSGEVALWYMNGASLASPQGIATVANTNWKIVGVGDFDRDGDPDILWWNQGTGEVALWYMNGASPVSPQGIATVPDTNWRIVGVADFNRDGNPDILWQHQGRGEVALWYMNGASPVSPQGIATVANTNWKIVGVADFNQNGNPDILWQHQATGEVALWYMNGASPVSPQGIATVPTSWKVMGVADFNRDGNPDILWRHQATGEIALWYMNGPNLISPQGIATIPDLNWEIVAP
jgi:hypothetical protein